MFYYAGFNSSPYIVSSADNRPIVDDFSEVTIENVTDMTLGWNYHLIWKENSVFMSEKYINNSDLKELSIPENPSIKFINAFAGKLSIVLISAEKQIWRYKLYDNEWKKIDNFTSKDEFAVKIDGTNENVCILTNYGRIYNIPTLMEISGGKNSEFTDLACGLEHTLMLTKNGDVYSLGGGSRGQLGHNDLENSDDPQLIEALGGLKVVKVAAGGWHNAVVTSDHDLYTWGWNTSGELGLESEKVVAVPTIVDFYDENNQKMEVNVTDVGCGNNFTVCRADDGQLWGCGSNKFGQLGLSRDLMTKSDKFVKLNLKCSCKNVDFFKCKEWSTILSIK